MPSTRKPNLFTLTGKKFSLNYGFNLEHPHPNFEPSLTYKEREKELRFDGSDIRLSKTEIGQLVTVTIEHAPDSHHVTVTVLLPEINLKLNEKTTFKTAALVTRHLTTMGGPEDVIGPLQTYSFEILDGVASKVE